MKARMINGTLEIGLPKNYKHWGGNFDKQSDEVHEAEGFFELITPEEFDAKLQKLGEVFFDEENKVFTYTIVKLPFDLEKKKAELLSQLDDQQDYFERLISRCERIYGKDNAGLNAATTTVLQTQAATVNAINNLTEETGRTFRIRQEDVDALKALFDPYKF